MKRIISLLIISLTLVGCSKNSPQSYEDLKDRHIEIEEIFSKNSAELVYFYSMYCDSCYQMKQNLFSFCSKNNNIKLIDISNVDPFEYMIDGSNMSDEEVKNKNVGVSNYKNLVFKYTPMILQINDDCVKNTYLGYKDCIDIFNN